MKNSLNEFSTKPDTAEEKIKFTETVQTEALREKD